MIDPPIAALTVRLRGLRCVGVVWRVAILAGCCLANCTAGSPKVRVVRVPEVDGPNLHFSHVSLVNAPARGVVMRMAQDDQGFLWIGTNHGLLRYDGYQFQAFLPNPTDPNSIHGVNVTALFKDRSGNLWIGLDQNLDRYDPVSGVFRHVKMDSSGACEPPGIVQDITQDREGIIWIATHNGLKRLDPITMKSICYQHLAGDNSSLASNVVMSVVESRAGTLWLASASGLDSFDRRTGRVDRSITLRGQSGAPLSLDGTQISLVEDYQGILWITVPIGQEAGLISFDPQSGVQSVYTFGDPDRVDSIIEDEDGTLWVGEGKQVIKLDRDRKRAFRYRNDPNDSDSVTAGGVSSLMRTRDHRIWLGFEQGSLDSTDPRPSPFHVYRHEPNNPNSLSAGAVYTMLEDSRGFLWIGGLGGLDRIDRKTGKVTRYAGKRISGRSVFNLVFVIAEDHAGNVWIGDWGNGLARFDPKVANFKFYRHEAGNPTSLSNDMVVNLFVDHRGLLWISTYEALNSFDPQTERFRVYRNALTGASQYPGIAEDSSGALWLASLRDGLQRMDPATGQFTVYRNVPGDARSLSDNGMISVYVDRSGRVWAGTNDGLNQFDPVSHKFKSYFARDGLASDGVAGILEDKSGNLWLSTNNGLSRFNPGTGKFTNYYSSDGLPDNQFNSSAAFKSSSGEMFFGSTSGLLSFVPEKVVDDPSPPPIVLTDFWLFGDRWKPGKDPLKQSISFTRYLTLAPDQNVFSFEFSALNFSDPVRNRYRYRLEGLDEHWIERDSSRRFVTYTTLAPRKYVFQVQGCNSRGLWNTTGVSVQLTVLGPWWTWWSARTAFVLLIAAAAIAFYRFRLRLAADRLKVRFEERLAERTRIARDLHDTLLQSFHGVLPRLQAVYKLLPGRSLEAKEILNTTIDDAAQAITEARDAVQNLRSSTVATNDLAKAVQTLGEDLAAHQTTSNGNAPTFSVEVEGAPQDVHPILRDEIYRITAEAMRNAFNHARARRIEVEISYSPRAFRVRVRDDGAGIDASVLGQEGREGHFGLAGMRERAEHIGGKLEVWSERGAGTEVELTLPASAAYGHKPGLRSRLLGSKVGTKE